MRLSWRWIGVAAAVAGAACGSSGRSVDVEVKVAYGAISTSSEVRLKVTCAGGYGAERVLTSVTQGEASAQLASVPVESDCAFAASGTEHRTAPASADVPFSASVTTRFARDASQPSVLLVLQSDLAGAVNEPPRIAGVTASGGTANAFGALLGDVTATLGFGPSAVVVLDARVKDPEGDPLVYRWDDGGVGGTFFDLDLDLGAGRASTWSVGAMRSLVGTAPLTVWVPPEGMAGSVHLTLAVKEARAGVSDAEQGKASLTVDSTVDDTRVKVGVSGVLNHWPDVLTLRTLVEDGSVGGQLVVGQRTRVVSLVRDLDRDPLTYGFTSACPGAFYDDDGAPLLSPRTVKPDDDGLAEVSAVFVPAAIPSDTVCRVSLALDDGRNGHMSGTLDLKVLTRAPVAFGPIVDAASSTAAAIGLGETVGLHVAASSRYGSATLSYHVDLMSAIAIPQELLPDLEQLDLFTGPKTAEVGDFAWKAPSTAADCAHAVEVNGGSTLYFLVTVTDTPALSQGVPATTGVVIPVELQCAATAQGGGNVQ